MGARGSLRRYLSFFRAGADSIHDRVGVQLDGIYLHVEQVVEYDAKRDSAHVISYEYDLSQSADRDEEGQRLISFHYEPYSKRDFEPHAMGHAHPYGAAVGELSLDDLHVPTGRLTLEEVVMFAVTEWNCDVKRLSLPSAISRMPRSVRKDPAFSGYTGATRRQRQDAVRAVLRYYAKEARRSLWRSS